MKDDETLDATGLKCPLPVLKARKAIAGLKAGQVLAVLADDPAGLVDFPHFCAEQGHDLLGYEERPGGAVLYRIAKGA